MARHELTPDERRRGQAKGAQTKRARRDEAEQEAKAKLDDAVDQAVATLVAELKAEASADRIRAAAQILDRSWGRPRQAHDVRVERDHDAAATRLKLHELIERHRRESNGDTD